MTPHANHPEWAALLRGIVEESGSDLARLVAADWLDENADRPHEIDYAEFIRVQCELATTPHRIVAGDSCPKCAGPGLWRSGPHFDHERICFCDTGHSVTWEPVAEIDNPAWVELRVRERQLLAANETLWSKPWRTKAAIQSLRRGGPGGVCCGRDADMLPCTCVADAPDFTWSRGFVSGVTLTLAQFVGGPCGECDGGYVRAGPDSHWCRACQGTGRTHGIASALFAAHPIEEVTLPDVGTVQSFGGWHFARWPDGFVVDLQLYETTYLIREPLWSRELVGPFRSAADAYAALNRRCVAWGRESAGRPPIGGRP